jgi:predicted O-methyltransferase YrrM
MIEFTARPAGALETTFLIPYYRSLPIYKELAKLNTSSVSMLHPDVLALMYHFAAHGEGPVLELGPYVGGSTIALGWGLQQRKRKATVVSIELGGRYDHPTAGTDDIVRDLRRNIQRFRVADYVQLIVGDSRHPDTVRQARECIGNEKAAVCCIDSDGNVEADMALYKELLAPGAYLIIDDYFAPGAPHKVKPTRDGISTFERRGLVACLGIYGWGSWVGRLT